jgi:protein SCO1/2
VAGALATSAAGCGSDDGGSGSAGLAGAVRQPPLEVGAVELPIASSGTPFAMRAAPGELLVVYFGYTSCPDICPTTLNDVGIAISGLPDDLAERVSVAFVTVDPDRDTAEVLEGYLAHFVERGTGLRAEAPNALAAAASDFGVQYEVADHEPGDATYDVAHTAVTYVVDDSGTVAVEWPFGFDDGEMTSDLRTLLQEASA